MDSFSVDNVGSMAVTMIMVPSKGDDSSANSNDRMTNNGTDNDDGVRL